MLKGKLATFVNMVKLLNRAIHLYDISSEEVYRLVERNLSDDLSEQYYNICLSEESVTEQGNLSLPGNIRQFCGHPLTMKQAHLVSANKGLFAKFIFGMADNQ